MAISLESIQDRYGDQSMCVLVVDASREFRTLLANQLQAEGFMAQSVACGSEALTLVDANGLPHLALIDLELADMGGFELAEALQQRGSVPIIFLAAMADVETKVRGLNDYAEDFVTKPFQTPELLARVRRVLLRVGPTVYDDYEESVDEYLRINFSQQYAVASGERILLTPTESRILNALSKNRGRILSADQLLKQVWNPLREGSLESLWVHIRRLRSKIEPDPDDPRYIVTARGQGYYMPDPNVSQN
jgi:DNA-binding response OmpR family regulator